MDVILNTINTRATGLFAKEVTKENFKEWADHWFTVAESVKSEFLAEGLISSAEATQKHIDQQRKLTDKLVY